MRPPQSANDNLIPGREHIHNDVYAIGGVGRGKDGSTLECAISIASFGSALVLRIHGVIDSSTAPFLRERFHRVIETLRIRHLTLDLTYCEFANRDGLALLLGVNRYLNHAGGQLNLAHPNPIIRRKLRITCLDNVFTLTA